MINIPSILRISFRALWMNKMRSALTMLGIIIGVGGVVGAVVGVSASMMLSSLSGWPTVVPPLSVLLAFGFSGLVGIFFGFYPAYKASLLNPIDALRYE